MLQNYTIKLRKQNKNKKNRMSHDNRFPKTNYLKTNLLKQIKKISLPSLRMILSFIYDAKLQKKIIQTK